MNKLAAICAAAIVLCHAAIAQNLNERVTVHFTSPVVVGETRLPAGPCDIQVLRGASNNTIIVFRSETGVTAAAVASRISRPEIADPATSVVLNRRGSDLHLYRVILADNVAYELNQVE